MTFADFIQWIGVARKHPLSALCAVICLLCGAACWYINSNMKWLDLEHKQVLQDADLAQASLISGPSVKAERLAALVITRQIEDNLVVEDNLAENLQYFYKIEDRTKAHILELRPLNSTVADTKSLYRRVPFSIRVTGTYEQVVGFLNGIETGPRLASITAMTLRRREPSSLTAILDVTVEMLGKK
jgi:Tfp pilus assembly protein PilO